MEKRNLKETSKFFNSKIKEKRENLTTAIKLADLVAAKFAIEKRWENSPLVLAWKYFEDKSSVQIEEIELEDMKLILQMVLEESIEATVNLRFIGENGDR